MEFSQEWNDNYRTKQVIHNPSGQEGFVPGCTLSSADVKKNYYIRDDQVLDLQGNVISTLPKNYDSVRSFADGYAVVKLYGKFGMINEQGREVIATAYDEIGIYEEHPFAYGYISAVKDGRTGFLDVNGQETTAFKYKATTNYSTFATLKDLDGSTIVLSAAVDELPERYQEVSFPTRSGCMGFVAQREKGEIGVVGLNGETLVPFTSEIRYISSVTLTTDARLALIRYGSKDYRLYYIDEQKLSGSEQIPAAEPTPAPEADGTWTCVNGHSGNSGNFCSECGSPTPVVQNRFCPNCGYELGDTAPNFCPNCGTKLN